MAFGPQERVTITYRPATELGEKKELPFRVAILGDFTLEPDESALEDRPRRRIDRENLGSVMENMGIELALRVPNRLREQADEELSVRLNVTALRDLEPEQIIRQVPELRELAEIRLALSRLKLALGRSPKLADRMQEVMVGDRGARSATDEPV